MTARVRNLSLVAFFLLAVSAHADDGVGAFTAGDFAAARNAGRGAGSAAGYELACEAGLVLGSYFEKGEARVHTLHGAIKDCAEAIKFGDAGAGPHVNYAIGFGFEAKRLHSVGAASASKKLFTDAVARFPDNGFAHAALAGWHSNVTRQSPLGRIALGASRDEARRGFATAVSLDPENLLILFEQFRFLAAGDRKDRRAAADAAAVIAMMTPSDAFGVLIVDKTRLLAAALSKGEKEIDAALDSTEPFAGVRGEARGLKFDPPFREGFPASGQRD